MTAKRFRVNELVKYNYSEIGEYIDENHTDRPLRNDILVELLNELHEENEQLKYNLSAHMVDLNNYKGKCSALEIENEQLKQFKEDVFNKIDMHLRMLPTARDNEFDEDDGDPSLYVGAIYMLETLKKELEE